MLIRFVANFTGIKQRKIMLKCLLLEPKNNKIEIFVGYFIGTILGGSNKVDYRLRSTNPGQT